MMIIVQIKSNPQQLAQALDVVLKHLTYASKIVAIPSIKLERFGITAKALKLIEKLEIPFVIMPHDKSVMSEHHPQYAGFYAGLLSDEGTSAIVESADLVLNLGDALWSDFNTAGFTNNLELNKVLNLAPLYVEDKDTQITNVYLSELLDALLTKVQSKKYIVNYTKPKLIHLAVSHAKLTLKTVYNQLLNFVKSSDNLVVETGSSSLNLPKFPLQNEVKYYNQTLWGSIGWATSATLGIALANQESRTILLTGEGSHQLTLNEIGVMGRYKINPIILCINNDGFMVERALEIDPDPSYDDLAQLNYSQLPAAFGCQNWLSMKVSTEAQLADALARARLHTSGAYIELITDRYDYGSTLEFFNAHLKEMYGS